MIKINLLGEESRADSGTSVFFGSWAASIALLIACLFFVHQSLTSEHERLTDDVANLKSELQEWQKKTKEVKDLELKQKQLSDKLSVIASLKKSKSGPVRVLDDLNLALSERSWLVSVAENAGMFTLSGMAIDDNEVAGFMERLERSDYFSKVELIQSHQIVQDGVKIREFEIRAGVSYLGKLELQRVQNEKNPSAAKDGKAGSPTSVES